MSEEDKKPDDLENPEEIFKDIDKTLDKMHRDASDLATDIGQERERMSGLRSYWLELGEHSTDDPDLAKLYNSGLGSISAFRDELQLSANEFRPITVKVRAILSSTDSTASITSSTSSAFFPGVTLPNELTLPRYDQSSESVQALKNIDPSLVDTYLAIREVLYGTRSDPERAALYLIRQMFDHFFGILAPSDEVRSSDLWEKKTGNNPDQVTRRERVRYVASVNVFDHNLSKRLLDSTDHMLEVYKLLNKAHKRGSL